MKNSKLFQRILTFYLYDKIFYALTAEKMLNFLLQHTVLILQYHDIQTQIEFVHSI